MLFNLDLASENIFFFFFNALHVMLHMNDKKNLEKKITCLCTIS